MWGYMKRIVALMTVAAACVTPAWAGASTMHAKPPATESLVLGSYSRGQIPTTQSSFKLAKADWYVATVSGTMSYWAPINYSKPQRPYKIVCGTPEGAAQYSGSRGGNGPVGLDAEFLFSRPWTKNACTRAHLPTHWSNFQASTGGGWAHPQILGGVPSAPTPDHTYSYVLLGRNQPVQFRLTDIYYRDNYGALHISLRPATTADCTQYYSSFGFPAAAACTSSGEFEPSVGIS